MTIERVLNKYEDELMARPGVQGVAIGVRDDRKVIKILVARLTAGTSQAEAQFPSELEGYPVIVEEIGIVRPL